MSEIHERVYRAWLRSCLALKQRSFRRLLAQCETAGAVFDLLRSQPSSRVFDGIDAREKAALRNIAHHDELKRVWWALQEKKIGVVLPTDPSYPRPLLTLHEPPLMLYMRGCKDTLQTLNCLCIVGMRKPSAYGEKTAYNMAWQWAKLGGCVVSGLAMGIDAAAHRGALDGGKHATIAVVTGGLDHVSVPQANAALFERIMREGLLISENPPGYAITKWAIPYRNRIMAGLSQGVLLVEAKQKSGTQHTVSAALDLGREVFAVPGRIDYAEAQLPNQLIREGAIMAHGIEDIIAEYPAMRERVLSEQAARRQIAKQPAKQPDNTRTPPSKNKKEPDAPQPNLPPLNPLQTAIVASLTKRALGLEELVMDVQQAVPLILRELSMLMAQGRVEMDASQAQYRLLL